MLDIKRRQIDSLTRLLRGIVGDGKPPLRSTTEEAMAYKVLVLDNDCRNLVAPLVKVNQLRAMGVTLHLEIEAERQPIQEVPVIYLVQGTAKNVDLIVKDFMSDLYGEYVFSFASRISRPLLETLAQGAVKANVAEKIARVEDQYMAFISLEKSLFSLGLPEVYTQLNDPKAKDTEIDSVIESIVDGLFCVFVTLGVIPIIKCPPGGAAEHICLSLDEKIRTALKTRNNLFSEASSGLLSSLSRPLLVIFERNFDLSAALQHSWSYKPLVQDVLGLKLNRVMVESGAEGGSDSTPRTNTKNMTCDVDEDDVFWQKCGAYSFPKIAEEVEIQLQNYKKAVAEINKKTAQQSEDTAQNVEGGGGAQIDTQNLMTAVSSLPELTERKKILDKHTSLATTLLHVIKKRVLDQYFNVEEDIVSGKADLDAMMTLLEGSKGTEIDKLRLASVYLLACSPLPTESEMGGVLQALGSGARDVVSYIRMLCVNKLAGSASQSSSGFSKVVHGPSEGTLLSWAEKNFSQGLSSVSKSVRNLLSGVKRSPVVAAVEALMDGKTESESGVATFRTFDPRSPQGKPGEMANAAMKEAVVFMVGGGNYLERESLDLWANSQSRSKHIIYGATEMLSAEEFVKELTTMATRQRA